MSNTQLREIIGVSQHTKDLRENINQAAGTDQAVLIQGPTGTGKELVANNIHFNSQRKEKPFIPVDCGAIATELFESELFGHKKGSFTHALSDKQGYVATAEGGTLFLDEIGNLMENHQAKLLRFLQDGSYRAVGDTKVKSSNVRIIAATNKDLIAELKKRRFREDLYYRLNEFPIFTIPLANRQEDVIALVNYFISTESLKVDSRVKILLYAYDLPGNVRELKSMLQWNYEELKRHLEEITKRRAKNDLSGIMHLSNTLDLINRIDLNYEKCVRAYEIEWLYHNMELAKRDIAEILHIRPDRLSPKRFRNEFGYDAFNPIPLPGGQYSQYRSIPPMGIAEFVKGYSSFFKPPNNQ
jgi:transcriptional regulator with PAS, ATPase and Fis domain